MATNKISKEDLKSPDAFMSFADKLGHFLAENKISFAIVFSVLILGGIGFSAMNMMNTSKENKARAAIFAYENKILEVRRERAKKEQDLIASFDTDKKENETSKELEKKQKKIEAALKKLPELNFETDFSSHAQSLEQTIKENSGTQSANHASIRLAKLYIDYKKYDDAIRVLNDNLSKYQKGTAVFGIARAQLASVLSYKGEVQKSISLLEEILQDQKLNYLYPEILLKVGVLQRELGDNEKSQEYFRRVSLEYADTEAGKTAKNYLKLIDFLKPEASNTSKDKNIDIQ